MGKAQGSWSSKDLDQEGEQLTCKDLNLNALFAHKLLVVTGLVLNRKAITMVDSGVSRNFLSYSFVQKHKIKIDTQYKDNIRLANRDKIKGEGTARSLRIHIGSYTASLSFSVTQLTQGYDVILGKPWLTKVNPAINWKTNEIHISHKNGNIVIKGVNGKQEKNKPKLENIGTEKASSKDQVKTYKLPEENYKKVKELE